jgi:dihydrodipicolinate synthase/N-acetylneuraminate lyase
VESNPMVPKWAAHRTGLIGSAYCRPPLDYMDRQYEAVVEDALRQAGLL